MLPSINLATDSLGLGQIFSGITQAKGTDECGSKPTCIAITKTCKEKNRAYNECRMRALELRSQTASNVPSSGNSGNLKMILIAVAVVAVLGLILFLIFKK